MRSGVDNQVDTVADIMDASAICAGPDWPLDHAYNLFRRMGKCTSVSDKGLLASDEGFLVIICCLQGSVG